MIGENSKCVKLTKEYISKVKEVIMKKTDLILKNDMHIIQSECV